MTSAAGKSKQTNFWVVGIILAQTVWLAWFLVVPLPSVGTANLRRIDLLLAADDHLRPALRNLSHVENLPQRLPILGATLLIAAASLAVGSALLSALGWHNRSRSDSLGWGLWGGWGLRYSATPGIASTAGSKTGVAGYRRPQPPEDPKTPSSRQDRGLTLSERVALGFGLGTILLGVATLLLGRWIGLNPTVVRWSLGGLIIAGVGGDGLIRWSTRDRVGPRNESAPRWSIGQVVTFAVVVGPFLLLMGLGAMLPTIEFDALEYHLQGPKEYFLDGRVGFLPHNVYASMPSGVEMLTTLAMEVMGDWWLGALAGQELIAWFAPAAAVLIAATATRISGSSRAGWFAAAVYLTTPWIFRAGGTPFVEGPLCFFHAALVWALVRLDWLGPSAAEPGGRGVAAGLLVGLLAGGAMAIKYPALISAVIPVGLVVLVQAVRAGSNRLVAGYAIGLGLVLVPWLGKNVADTGNPVYPLAWSIFGGTEWDADRDTRWHGAHGPRPVSVELLVRSLVDVAGRSDWQSPLYAALVPLAWLAGRRRVASLLAGYAAYVFLTWWFLTHRLDRFWLPMLPALAILAGLGANAWWTRFRVGPAWLRLVLAVGIGSNLLLCATDLSGPTTWTGDLATVRVETARDGTPSLARLDAALPPNAHPMVIGQAGTFSLRHRPAYNTVFNRDLFDGIAHAARPEVVARDLHQQRITHVYVDWAEIERYRQPGNYGFTDFETPAVFDRLVAAGVLGPAHRLGASQVLYEVR